jgi:DNA-binding MarR family transcriptional regulator
MGETTPDRDAIASYRDHHIGRLFLRAHRDFSERAMCKLQERGHDGLGPAHMGLLPHLDVDGTRASVLAERAAISKQAAGVLVQDLESKGYVRREPDPADRRAAIVCFTADGERFLRDAYDVKHEIEAEYRAILGESGFDRLQHLLSQIVDDPPMG